MRDRAASRARSLSATTAARSRSTGPAAPGFAFWLEGQGWGVENHGVDPDVEVVVPQDRVAGRDPQLDVAIRVALEALGRRPATEPPEPPTV